MEYLFAIAGILVIVNLYMFFKRYKKGRYTRKNVESERMAIVKRHADLELKLKREQEDAARRVELQNKTLELYEQVRRNAEADEKQEADEQSLGKWDDLNRK